MTIVTNDLHGDYQLANGYGHDSAEDVLRVKFYTVNISLYSYAFVAHYLVFCNCRGIEIALLQ